MASCETLRFRRSKRRPTELVLFLRLRTVDEYKLDCNMTGLFPGQALVHQEPFTYLAPLGLRPDPCGLPEVRGR
jgi:hypothetical protein